MLSRLASNRVQAGSLCVRQRDPGILVTNRSWFRCTARSAASTTQLHREVYLKQLLSDIQSALKISGGVASDVVQQKILEYKAARAEGDTGFRPLGQYSCVHCPLETLPYDMPSTLGYLGRGAFEPKDLKVAVQSAVVHFDPPEGDSQTGPYRLKLDVVMPDHKLEGRLTFVGTYTLLANVGSSQIPDYLTQEQRGIALQFKCLVLGPRGTSTEGWYDVVSKHNHGSDDMGQIVSYKDYYSAWQLLHASEERVLMWTPQGRVAFYAQL